MIGPVETPEMPPQKLALIIDGEVVEMLHTDERLTAIFLSNPTIVDVTETYAGESLLGRKYDEATGTFN